MDKILAKITALQADTAVLVERGVITPKQAQKRLDKLKTANNVTLELANSGYEFTGATIKIMFELVQEPLQTKFKKGQDYLEKLLDFLV